MGKAGLMGVAFAGLIGCTTALPEDGAPGADHAATPHGHDEAVYPATPYEVPLPLKSAEYPGAIYSQARFYTPGRSRQLDTIVIHTTEGRYQGAIDWFRNPNNQYKTSAHYVIRSSDGQITQMVRESDTAHHVRGYNSRSIGIEHEAFVAQSSWYTDAMYQSSANLVRYLCQKYRIPMDRQHIRSHAELDPSRRSDPGPHWDWDRFMRMVANGAAPPAEGDDPPAGECTQQLWTCNAARTARYRCAGGEVAETQACAGGCQGMPVGQDDVCRPGANGGESWGACTAAGIPGTCVRTADCTGRATPGLCPGPNDVQCCTQAPEPPAEQPPAEQPPARPPVNQACSVDGVQGICMAPEAFGACQTNLAYSATCGDAAACCVDLSGPPEDPNDPNDPADPNDPPPARPPPAEPPPADGPCTAFGVQGECMTAEDAFFGCPWPQMQAWQTADCRADSVCCIQAPAEDPAPPPEEDRQVAGDCRVAGVLGECLPTRTCAAEGGQSTPGYCPGPNDIQCCTW